MMWDDFGAVADDRSPWKSCVAQCVYTRDRAKALDDLLVGWWVWRSDSTLVSINEVNLHRARLVLGWVTVSGFKSRCRTFISVCNQPPRSTQPGHPFVGRRNEYQPKGGDALQLGSKGRYGSCVGGR